MPQIIVKRSAVPGKVPTTTDLALGEIAINTNDGRMFFEKDAGTPSIVEVATLDGTQTISGIKTFDGAVYFSGTVQPTFRATSAAEGGQIVLAYANNTTAMGQGNSTWNIDVAGFSDQLLRFFRVNSSGVADVALTIPDTGAITFNRGITLGTNGFSANGSLGSAGQVLTTNGTSTYWSTVTGGGGGATNLTYSANGSTVTVFSDTGTDAIVLAANSTIAGVLTAEAQTIGGAKTFSSTITGSITGNAGTATTLATARNINGVSFNGSADITITANTPNALTFNNGGTGAASGSTFNGGSAVTISHNTIGASPLAGSTSLTTLGTITTGTWNGSLINSTYGGTGVNNGGRTLTINTGNLTITSQSAGSSITLGGNISTANSVTTSGNFALTLTTTAATNVTLPTSGTLISSADTGTVTSTMIANGTIVDADINASAAIAVSKLAASTISGVTLGNNLNTLTLGTYLTGTSYNGSAAVTAAVDATSAATAGKIVARDASGNFSANTITGSTVNITRTDGNPQLNFSTSVGGQTAYQVANNSAWSAVVVAGANTSSYPYFQILGDNNGLIYNAGKGGGDQRVWHAGNDGTGSGLDADLLDGLNSASAATASTIVARDASGNFSANTITAALTGNASTATTLQTARNINGVSFNGSADITVTSNTPNSLTFNNGGAGAASGSTFNGGSAVTISHNTIGASPLAGSTSLTTLGTITTGTWNGSTIGIAYGGTGETVGPVGYTALRGYLAVTAGSTQTLTSSSPNLINVTGAAATTINLPDVTTLTLGRTFVIRNSSGGFAVTVRTSTAATVVTIAANSEVRLIALSTSDNSAAGWAAYFTGFSGTSGGGNVVRATSPTISGLTLTGTLTANSSVGTAGQVLTSSATGVYWAAPTATALAAVSDTAPSTPTNGQMWFDSSDGSFNVYYNDGTSAQWINAVNNQNDPVFRVKTSNYTASNRDQIIADTSGGSFTITLPASPIAGTSVTLYDNASWGTNNLTIARNGSTIEGVADDFVLDVSSIKVEFIYNGSTWQVYSSVAQGGPATTPTVSSAEFAAIAIALG